MIHFYAIRPPTLLHVRMQRTRGGSLFFGAGMNTYTKKPKTLEAQLDNLIQRGLVVADRVAALRWLSQVSYYCLRGYT